MTETNVRQVHQRSRTFFACRKKIADLVNLYRAFLVITPTSVEAERVFSAAGIFLTKLRTRMGDQILDKLIFLRFHLLSLSKDTNINKNR